MRISREEFLERRLRSTEIQLLRSLIGCWLLGAALIITLAVVFDKLPS